MDFESPSIQWLYFFAHVLTLLGFIVGFILSIKKNKTIIGVKIEVFLYYVIKIALILLALILIFMSWKSIHAKIWGENNYWDNKHWMQHILTYLISVIILFLLVWMIMLFIWSFSIYPVFSFLNLLIPKLNLTVKRTPLLQITKAIYGSDTRTIDVTFILNQRIVNNELRITADNSIAGDPHFGAEKKLIIWYRYGNSGVLYRSTIDEYKYGKIPTKALMEAENQMG